MPAPNPFASGMLEREPVPIPKRAPQMGPDFGEQPPRAGVLPFEGQQTVEGFGKALGNSGLSPEARKLVRARLKQLTPEKLRQLAIVVEKRRGAMPEEKFKALTQFLIKEADPDEVMDLIINSLGSVAPEEGL